MSLTLVEGSSSFSFLVNFTGLARASKITGLGIGIRFETVSGGSNDGEGEGGTYRNEPN